MQVKYLDQDFSEFSLGDLFAAADEVGDKYQTEEEKEEFKAKLAKAVSEVKAVM